MKGFDFDFVFEVVWNLTVMFTWIGMFLQLRPVRSSLGLGLGLGLLQLHPVGYSLFDFFIYSFGLGLGLGL